MDRQKAINELKKPPETDPEIVKEVKKRLGFTDKEFNRIMTQPNKTHHDYETYQKTFRRWKWFFWVLSKLDLVPKTFYVKYTR